MAESPFAIKKNLWIFTGCWLLWAFIHYGMLRDWDIRWDIALADTLVSNALLAGACLLISNTLRFYRPKKNKYIYLLIWCIALSGLWSGAVKLSLALSLSPEVEYVKFLNKSMPIRFDIAFLLIGCVALLSMLWYNAEEQQQIETRKSDAEKLAKEAELYTLRQQLQPHFLFNSLNSISALSGSRPEQARKMIQQLSDFLRGTLKKEDSLWVSLDEELQHLQLYLEIEKVRFGHRLETSLINDGHSLQSVLPPMILQPIVENAIKFGLYDTTDEVIIELKSYTEDNYLVISVENPFDPETSSPKQGTGFGLSSLQRRLYLLFARNDLLTTTAINKSFITTVKIPQPHDQSNPDR